MQRKHDVHPSPTEHNQDAAPRILSVHTAEPTKLRHTSLRIRMLLAVGPGSSCFLVVSATILHAPLLHQLQHQFPPVLSLRDHLPSLHVSTCAQEFQAFASLPHEPPAVHLNGPKGNNWQTPCSRTERTDSWTWMTTKRQLEN
ncbi:uncharacterized protein LOC111875750 [Cryptotermes secundus]|uniref:uncharacterized protein LOC111875750 n=1 Tax=Cryptotermes secundus TaxID=105785 RepID=UPI000CD7BD4A|nr:uncharacterized protein LOC111875750 [Cryptotermes secundus]